MPGSIAHRLVAGLGDVHRAQLAGPVQPRQLARVAPIGLDPLSHAARDERGRHDRAVDPQLRATPREHETRRPRLIADAQLRAAMGLLEFRENLLHGVQIIGDRAVEARLPAAAFGECEGQAFGVDVESEKQ